MPFMVITGASDGIGRALAIEFAKRGYSLGLLARRLDRLEETAAACRAFSPRVCVAAVDVTDSERLRTVLREWWDAEKGIDVFVANAGLALNTSDREDGFSDMLAMIRVNLIGAIDGMEFLKPKMVARGHGTLVGISSMASARGMPKSGGYCLTKAALHSYLEALRMDVRSLGLTVCEVAPGYIDTAMTKPNAFTMPFLMPPEVAAKKIAKRILRRKKFTVVPWPYRLVYPVLKNAPEGLVEFIMGDGA